MPGACTTCMETCGSGCRIGMALNTTKTSRRPTRRDPDPALTRFIGAVAGCQMLRIAGPLLAVSTFQGIVTTTSVFASYGKIGDRLRFSQFRATEVFNAEATLKSGKA